jgi:A/G-specific adenine glycosylase
MKNIQMFSQNLLSWYDKNKRDLPWRSDQPNSYHVWLSEIMLQQTTVASVIPYFQTFIQKWPHLQDLAQASLDEILTEWQGLGYYSRARNLHTCGKALAQHFPKSEKELLKLPGIGPYTAAAIASIAFNQKAGAVDGNVIRVISRYFAIENENPKTIVSEKLQTLLPNERFGDFTQALMELGALICRPKSPSCASCPLQSECQGRLLDQAERFPLKSAKQKIPTRYAKAFILKRKDGAILLRKRPPKGLLGGMMEVPTTPWETKKTQQKGTLVRHTFTHFHLEVDVCAHENENDFQGIWVKPEDLSKYALPTLMKKILKAGL